MSTPARKQPRRGDGSPRGRIVVEISDTQGFLKVDASRLAGLAERVLRGEGIQRAAISLALVDNATIHRINREHLGHDWPTDVISFALSGPDQRELVGELVVSAEMARATAAEINADPSAELSLYVVHGLLHLCGYDDTCDPDIQLMRARENLALEGEGLANTFPLAEQLRPSREEREQAAWSG